jgi:hypothetical protein
MTVVSLNGEEINRVAEAQSEADPGIRARS